MRSPFGLAVILSFAPPSLAQPAFYGFEQPEGFFPGSLNGQQGWSEFDASVGAGADIVTLGGGQALRLTDNPGVPNGAFVGALSPKVFDPGERGALTVDVRIDDLAGASYTVVGQSIAKFGITFRVVFEFGGTIFVVDDTGKGAEFIDTNVFFTRGAFEELRVEWAPDATRYFYAGDLIYASTSTGFARALDQVVLASDGWQDGGFPVGEGPIGAYFDNLTIAVPAPAGAAALALPFLLATRRRHPRYAGVSCAS